MSYACVCLNVQQLKINSILTEFCQKKRFVFVPIADDRRKDEFKKEKLIIVLVYLFE